MSELDDFLRSLTNVAPSEEQIQRIESLRGWAKDYASAIMRHVPEGRERSLAKTKLEESVMWAVKAIALETP